MATKKLQSQAQDTRDVIKCANAYLSFHRCRLCGHLTVAGYICLHCKGDDSDMPYPEARPKFRTIDDISDDTEQE